jgi:hypothetical protein
MRRFTIVLGVIGALALCAFAGRSTLLRARDVTGSHAAEAFTEVQAQPGRTRGVARDSLQAGPDDTRELALPAFAADRLASLSPEQLGRIEPTLRILQNVWQEAHNRDDRAALAAVDDELVRLVAATRGVDAAVTTFTKDSKNLGGR